MRFCPSTADRQEVIPLNTIEAILTRRSIRSFTDRQISRQDLDTILKCATYAPSGMNNQSWQFTVVQDADTIARIARTVRETFRIVNARPDGEKNTQFKKPLMSDTYDCTFHAPTFIIASNVADYHMALQDCACALENIFLAAHELGIASCWVNQLYNLSDEDHLRELLVQLGVPENHRICGCAALGYAATTVEPKERKPGTVVFAPALRD